MSSLLVRRNLIEEEKGEKYSEKNYITAIQVKNQVFLRTFLRLWYMCETPKLYTFIC